MVCFCFLPQTNFEIPQRALEYFKRFVLSPYKKENVTGVRFIWYVKLHGFVLVIKSFPTLFFFSDSFTTPWTLACQAPLSMGFSRQEHWSGLPFPSPGDLPDPGIESLAPVCLLHCRQILYHWATGKSCQIRNNTIFFMLCIYCKYSRNWNP